MTLSTIASLAATGIMAGKSAFNSVRNRRLADEAQRAADIATAKMEGLLEVNAFDALPVAKQANELALRNYQVTQKEVIQAQREAGVRGVAPLGTVLQSSSEFNRQQAANVEKQMRENAIKQAAQRQKNLGSLAEVEFQKAIGSAARAADEENQSNRMANQALQLGLGFATTALKAPTLYGNKDTKIEGDSAAVATQDGVISSPATPSVLEVNMSDGVGDTRQNFRMIDGKLQFQDNQGDFGAPTFSDYKGRYGKEIMAELEDATSGFGQPIEDEYFAKNFRGGKIIKQFDDGSFGYKNPGDQEFIIVTDDLDSDAKYNPRLTRDLSEYFYRHNRFRGRPKGGIDDINYGIQGERDFNLRYQ
tara:strand:- start:1767 stop:2852 length:1086 start_codon:yes stop_codon:yes gene_type:complete